MTFLKKALKPFHKLVRDYTPAAADLDNNTENIETSPIKSSFYYQNLVDKKREKPNNARKLQAWAQDENINITNAYQTKIKNIKDFKIAEFNYKIINKILSCNKNLKVWGKSDTDICDACNEVQDIPHLLFNCRYAKHVWDIVQHAFDFTIEIKHVLVGHGNTVYDFCISLMAYIIYKEWVIQKHKDKTRLHINPSYFISELKFRIDIYALTHRIDIKTISQLQRIKQTFLEYAYR